MGQLPGTIVLFGSGETSASAQRAHDFAMRRLTPPVRACVLETPAGFELNSDRVAGRLADFLRTRLQNYRPEVVVVPARSRGTVNSPDEPTVVAPLFDANYLMMGPGSPTYAVRQLVGSLAWQIIQARHRLGSSLVLASAGTIAVGVHALPIYEVFKVGDEPHWKPGLNLLGPFGLSLTFVPHWNNNQGGEELDTSRCFLGRSRFDELRQRLPADEILIGIEENTALVLDFEAGVGQAMGPGGIILIRGNVERRFDDGDLLDMKELGDPRTPDPGEGIPESVWRQALAAQSATVPAPSPSDEVLALVEARADARKRRDWASADQIRDQILSRGWQVDDTPEGPRLVPLQQSGG